MALMPEDRDKIQKAFSAMRSLGIKDATVKPILKKLLKLYGGDWKLIEEDNYQTLADAIFEAAEEQENAEPPSKKQYKGASKDKVQSTLGNGKTAGDSEAKEKQKQKTLNGKRSAESSQPFFEDHMCEPDDCSHDTAMRRDGGKLYVDTEHKETRSSPAKRVIMIEDEKQYAIVPIPSRPINKSAQSSTTASNTSTDLTSTSQNSVKRNKNNGSSSAYNHPEGDKGKRVLSSSGLSVPRVPAIAQRHPIIHDNRRRVFHEVHDITNGTEKVKISLLDEIGDENLPQYIYIPENIVYQSAYVHVSLARIADDDCCPGCIGNCLSSSIPCACARNTGGEFAYTPDGLLDEKFLESCISMKRNPESHHLFYCQDCPLERAKNLYMPESCKGHLLRKFIKECWRKCGCSMQCGNRIVQRGISRKLQVFLTSDSKGWGLRTLEELPKGAFVCEYAGEILTNIELYERNKNSSGKDKHVYPVLLDADWATEEVLKDEDALCLDATYYGNVARFINHRCFDGNLVEIPVQIETPDRHYYHLAFFTSRKVEALEELTWDYGIDFDDKHHPIKAFRCRCGSLDCRDRRGKSY